MNILVAYYSRAGENYFGGEYRNIPIGNTEKAARIIAEKTGGDLFQIEQKTPYSVSYRTCIKQARLDLEKNTRPELIAFPCNMDVYDTIYLGFPNYWGDMPMAVYSFLEAFSWNGKCIYPFCTHEGSGFGETLKKIAITCNGADIRDGLAIRGSNVDHSKGIILNWLKK